MAKSLTGFVTANSTDKTIVVKVETRQTHPLYKKQYLTTKKFMAHDEKNEAEIGDRVIIDETRPLSARKRHVLSKVVEKAAISADMTVEAITKAEEPGAREHIKDREETPEEETK
jgi:small subunit ribosomal protein S17